MFRAMLQEVLVCYSVYDQEVGYVQGMNLIAASLLYHIKLPQNTFWVLVDLMETQELRQVYVRNMEALSHHCACIETLLQTKLSNLHEHMQILGINIRCFLDGWLLSLMSKIVPLEDMHHVLSGFREKGWPFLHRLIVRLLEAISGCLLMSEDES